jgi:drug/metabolite transporter (DMT)-like permease
MTLIWGSTWLVITGQLGSVPAVWSISYRFAIGAAAMFAYATLTGMPTAIGRQGHLLAAAFGIAQFCFNVTLVYLAERYITSGLVAVIFALLIVPNSLFAWLFLKHQVSRRFIVGSCIAVAGVAMLFIQEIRAAAGSAGTVATGISLALLGMLCASVASIIQASKGAQARPIMGMIAWGMVHGVIGNSVFALLFIGPPVFDTSPAYVWSLLYLGLLGSALVFPLYIHVIREAGPGFAGYSNALSPFLAMMLSTIFEDYRWSLLAALGGLFGITGLVIALRARRPVPANPVDDGAAETGAADPAPAKAAP